MDGAELPLGPSFFKHYLTSIATQLEISSLKKNLLTILVDAIPILIILVKITAQGADFLELLATSPVSA